MHNIVEQPWPEDHGGLSSFRRLVEHSCDSYDCLHVELRQDVQVCTRVQGVLDREVYKETYQTLEIA